MSNNQNNILVWVASVIAIPAFGWMIVTIAATQSRVSALEATTSAIVKTQDRLIQWTDKYGPILLETNGAVKQLTREPTEGN
jgi:hypothetical protein